MDWGVWAKEVGTAVGERASVVVSCGIVIWWFDDLRAMADSIGTFILMVCFLYGIAWFFIGMIWAVIGRPLAHAWLKVRETA
jgi:hypothetical protein